MRSDRTEPTLQNTYRSSPADLVLAAGLTLLLASVLLLSIR